MQPENQQGYYQPGTDPNTPVGPQPQAQPTAAQPVQPVDPAAMQAALNEPDPNAQVPQEGLPEEEYTDEEFVDEDETAEPEVTWVAHEYIHHEKGAKWFVIFALVIAALMAVSIFFMNSWSFAVLLAVIPVAVIVYSKRPPRELTYSLSDDGLMIDDKLHDFADFKSFGVIHDGQEFSVMLIPTQRFQPGVTVYFPEESGEAIVDVLGSRLPMKDLKLDIVDRIVRMLRL